jgi:hypothetical protein
LKLIDVRESRAVVIEIAIEVAKLLDIPLWLTPAQPFVPYKRRSDAEKIDDRHEPDSRGDDSANRGNLTKCLTLYCSPYGSMTLSIDGCPSVFFDSYESTESPHVYRALNVLAEAIRRDNQERPQAL